MSTQPILDTPENWDLASAGYATKIAPNMMAPFADSFVEALKLNPDSSVLEVAAGSGAITKTLAQRAKELLATDFSPAMISILQGRKQSGKWHNTSCEVMDGQALKIPDNTFDRAICSFGLMLFPDQQKGFSELYRVVKPGGRAVVAVWAQPEYFESFQIFMAAMNRAFPDMPKPDSPPPLFSLADPEVLATKMSNAGFKDVTVEFVDRKLEIDSTDSIWEMITTGAPPVRLLFDKIGEDGQGHLRKTLDEVVLERFGNSPLIFTNRANLASGTV